MQFTSGDGMAQDSARPADCYLKAANDRNCAGCRGSESARDSVALAMTWEEVHEGCRRAATFAATAAKPGS